ncbi:MAG: ABC transporter permease [Gemmatimonadota bacterium]
MSAIEFDIAWRYLRSRRGSKLLSFISVIAIGGVVVGVSALIVVMGVMNGLQRDLREKILIGSPDIRVLSYGEDLKIVDWRSIMARVRSEKGVVAVAPFVLTQGVISAGHDYSEGAYIAGIEPQARDAAAVTTIREHAIQGDFRFASSDGLQRGVVIGKLLAAKLNAYPGDTIVVITIAGTRVNRVTGSIVPRPVRFEVTGVFETGMYEYDNAYIYLSLAAAQDIAGLDSAVTGLEVKTTDRWNAPEVAPALAERLGFPYRTVDWQEQNSSLFQALKLEKLGMGVILLLIVVVAAFNIVSNLTMVVADKTKEIGILKAMGMTARSVRKVFLTQGLVIGLTGTMLGLALGLIVSVALGTFKLIKLDPSVYFIDHLPVATEWTDVVLTVVASVAIAALATLYPAQQAAKLYPIEAIRHE